MAIVSTLTWWTISQLLALCWLLLLGRSKSGARLMLALLFFAAAWVNWTVAREEPLAYLGFGRHAWLAWYGSFIGGWFSANVRLFVGGIAVAQLVIAALLCWRGNAARLGLAGSLVFFLAIIPLGFGAGFPLPLILMYGAYRLLGHVDESLPAFFKRSCRGTWGRGFAVWLGMLGLAFVNGGLRELVISPFLGEPLAHHVSALTGAALFGTLAWSFWPRVGVQSLGQAWQLGLLWLTLTVAAESLLIGRWLGGKSWSDILAAYDLVGGSSWPLVLAWILILPSLLWVFRRPGPLRSMTPLSANSR